MQIKDEMEWLLDEYVDWIQVFQREHNYTKILENIAKGIEHEVLIWDV